MILYVSGAITRTPGFRTVFSAATDLLSEAGYDVINPADNFRGRTHLERKTYMRLSIHQVLNADGLALLPGWRNSEGAKLEVAIAKELEIPVEQINFWLSRVQKNKNNNQLITQ